MNKEIKEILDDLRTYKDRYEYFLFNNLSFSDRDYKAKLLYKFITDLQERDKEWSMIFDTFSKRPYAHKYLEQKKKELGNKNIIGLDSEMIYKDYYELKSRNEKAIKYINKKWKMNNYYQNVENCLTFCDFDKDDLLNILQGSDNK